MTCEKFGVSHDIKYNPKKSAIMIVRSKMFKDSSFPNFSLNNETIRECQEIKYLGHFLTNNLTDDADIRRQIRQTYVQANMLLRKFHMCSLDVKIKLFRTYCSCLYTAQLWWSYKKSTINKLYVAFHNTLKLYVGASKFVSTGLCCALFDVQCCQSVIRNLVYKFIVRVDTCHNSLICAILTSSVRYKSNIRKHWQNLLCTHS